MPFISPAGEPFRAGPDGADPMRRWFDQADANHDGALSLDEMIADHRRFFARVDTNGDGIIDAPEFAHYEEVITPEILSSTDRAGSAISGGASGPVLRPREIPAGRGRGGPGGGGEDRGPAFEDAPADDSGGFFGGRGADLEGAARYGLLNEVEPLRSADTDLDFRVSRAEWDAAAARRFSVLDARHDGKITFEELHRLQPAPGGRGGGLFGRRGG